MYELFIAESSNRMCVRIKPAGAFWCVSAGFGLHPVSRKDSESTWKPKGEKNEGKAVYHSDQ